MPASVEKIVWESFGLTLSTLSSHFLHPGMLGFTSLDGRD